MNEPDNSTATPETIRISLPGLPDTESDRLRQIQKEVAERPSDEKAMESACGEYNCPCHYQIGFLLEVIAKTTAISLPALRAVLMATFDDGDPTRRIAGLSRCEPWELDHAFPDVANDCRMRFADELERRLRQLLARG